MNTSLSSQIISSPTLHKPGKLTAISIMVLISGIGNVIYGLAFILVVGLSVLGGAMMTLGIGLICTPIACLGLYPLILGIFEIINAAQLLSDPPKVRPSKPIAIMQIVDILVLNVYTLVVGILTLVFMEDPDIQTYYGNLNSQSPSVSVSPPV